MSAPRIIVTAGDPAAIGPDIAVTAAAAGARVVIIGDRDVLAARAKMLGIALQLADYDGKFPRAGAAVLHAKCAAAVTAGKFCEANARQVLDCINRATDLCIAGEFDAMVTCPVNKAVINRAGIAFRGHTEYIAARCNARMPVMMLANKKMRVGLLSTHVPLAEVTLHVTAPRVTAVCEIILDALRARFCIANPALGVCGLNPHAGEEGILGREEIDIIAPALQTLRARGENVVGPLPADTAFLPARLQKLDAVLAMYHDQALPVVKHADFRGSVNITLGLPIIRTSVDHGTAVELAGSGRADASSLHAAVQYAAELARNRGAE